MRDILLERDLQKVREHSTQPRTACRAVQALKQISKRNISVLKSNWINWDLTGREKSYC